MSEILEKPARPNPSIEEALVYGSPHIIKLLEIMPGWLWETNAQHIFTYQSSNRSRVTYGPDDSVGKSRLENFQRIADRGQEIREHIDDFINHRPFRNFVYRLDIIGNRVSWVSTSGEPCFDAEGIFTGYQGFAMVVTPIMDAAGRSVEAENQLIRRNKLLENKIASRTHELQIANNRLSDVVEGMDHGVLCFSGGALDEQRILLANHRVADMLEIPQELVAPGRPRRALYEFCTERGDLVDADPSILFEPNDGRSSMSFIRTLPSGRSVQTLIQHAANGTIVSTFTDVTDLKRRESELEAARAAAVKADRAKSEFLANMSHEIRTPMNGVLGMAALLRASELDSRQQVHADAIVQSGSTLLRVLNDVLDFSKISAGQISLDIEPFRLSETVTDVVTLMRAAADEKGIAISVCLQNGLPLTILGDMARVRQVLTNLIGNAIKFTDEGSIRIEVAAESKPHEDRVIRLSIIDTGVGIPPDKLGHIFHNFTQVDSTMTRRHDGTGLGLAISKQLVELMGGNIGVTSEIGYGSTFWLTLPLQKYPGDYT